MGLVRAKFSILLYSSLTSRRGVEVRMGRKSTVKLISGEGKEYRVTLYNSDMELVTDARILAV